MSGGAFDKLMSNANRRGSTGDLGSQGKKQRKASPPKRERATSGSTFVTCPLCQKDFHRALIEAHTEGCVGADLEQAAASTGAGATLISPVVAEAGSQAQPRPVGREPQSQGDGTGPSQPRADDGAKGGAFAAIMGTPQAPRHHTLWLLRSAAPGGPCFNATWEPQGPKKGLSLPSADGPSTSGGGGAAQVAWRCSIMLKDEQCKTSPIELNVVLSADAADAQSAAAAEQPTQDPQPRPPAAGKQAAQAYAQGPPQRPRAPAAPRNAVTLLKSAFQKNVRLSRPEPAARCFRALLEMDANEALRRICIVCIEDGILHPELGKLTWAMAAVSKGFALSDVFRRELVRIAFSIAACPVRDRLAEGEPLPGRPGPASVSDPLLEDAETGPGREGATLVRCMLLRAQFGGMPGDVDMLRDFASAWLARFSRAGPPPPPLPAAPGTAAPAAAQGRKGPWLQYLWGLHDDIQSQVALGPLVRADVPPTAADFHCCNILDWTMQDNRLGPDHFAALVRAHGCPPGAGSQAALKSCIWQWRSSTNNKRALRVASGGASGYASDGGEHPQGGALWEAWRVIEPVVQTVAQRYVTTTLASIGVTS